MHFDFGILEMHLKNTKLKRKSEMDLKMHFHGFRKWIANGFPFLEMGTAWIQIHEFN